MQTTFFPALVSLSIYVALSYVILPMYRRHRQRYAQYLPLETISQRTSGLQARTRGAIGRALLHFWNQRHRDNQHNCDEDGRESWIAVEDGEGLVDFSIDSQQRAPAPIGESSAYRLSRDLEEGFQDSSDEESRSTDPRRTAQ